MLWIFLVIARFIFNWDANEMVFDEILSSPNKHAWLGRDDYGRSILTRLVDGLLNSFGIVLIAISLSVLLGSIFGTTGPKKEAIIDITVTPTNVPSIAPSDAPSYAPSAGALRSLLEILPEHTLISLQSIHTPITQQQRYTPTQPKQMETPTICQLRIPTIYLSRMICWWRPSQWRLLNLLTWNDWKFFVDRREPCLVATRLLVH